MNNQRLLEKLFVEELRKRDALEDVICEYDIENIRECNHCHALMNEGWMCGESYHYCSEECLLAENPQITREELDNLVADDDSDIYWTEWEG